MTSLSSAGKELTCVEQPSQFQLVFLHYSVLAEMQWVKKKKKKKKKAGLGGKYCGTDIYSNGNRLMIIQCHLFSLEVSINYINQWDLDRDTNVVRSSF